MSSVFLVNRMSGVLAGLSLFLHMLDQVFIVVMCIWVVVVWQSVEFGGRSGSLVNCESSNGGWRVTSDSDVEGVEKEVKTCICWVWRKLFCLLVCRVESVEPHFAESFFGVEK